MSAVKQRGFVFLEVLFFFLSYGIPVAVVSSGLFGEVKPLPPPPPPLLTVTYGTWPDKPQAVMMVQCGEYVCLEAAKP